MATYLVGMLYHEAESWALYQRGVTEDFESSTGIFVDAPSADEAIAWAEKVAEALLRKSNADETLDWKGLGYHCWVESDPNTSGWIHCLSFFRHVKAGEWPDLNTMGMAAYSRWAERHGIKFA